MTNTGEGNNDNIKGKGNLGEMGASFQSLSLSLFLLGRYSVIQSRGSRSR